MFGGFVCLCFKAIPLRPHPLRQPIVAQSGNHYTICVQGGAGSLFHDKRKDSLTNKQTDRQTNVLSAVAAVGETVWGKWNKLKAAIQKDREVVTGATGRRSGSSTVFKLSEAFHFIPVHHVHVLNSTYKYCYLYSQSMFYVTAQRSILTSKVKYVRISHTVVVLCLLGGIKMVVFCSLGMGWCSWPGARCEALTGRRCWTKASGVW